MNISNIVKKIIFLIIFSLNILAFAQVKSDNILPKITSSDVKLFPTYKISYFNILDNRNNNDIRIVTEICGNWTAFFGFNYPTNNTSNDSSVNLVSKYSRFDVNKLKVTWKDVNRLNATTTNKFRIGELPNGNWVFTYANGGIRSTGRFIMGKPEGEWIYYDNYGKIEATENYTNGLPDGIWKFKDGSTKSFKNGYAHGKWFQKTEIEQRFTLNFNEGRIDGEQIFSLNGIDILKFNIQNDKLNGKITLVSILNPRELRLEGNFLNGVPNGDWNYHAISQYHHEEKQDLVNSYYAERKPISSHNNIYKKVVYSSNKISEYELYNNSELRLVSEKFLEYAETNFDFEYLPSNIKLKTCIDTINNNSSKFNYIDTVKSNDDDEQIDTIYCMPYKKIKYYKNGTIQYISFYPEKYAKENNPQYFSPDGVVMTNCTFKEGNWIFTDLDGTQFIEEDERYGYFNKYYLSNDGQNKIIRTSIEIKRQ